VFHGSARSSGALLEAPFAEPGAARSETDASTWSDFQHYRRRSCAMRRTVRDGGALPVDQ
jgi:hypothetical protein